MSSISRIVHYIRRKRFVINPKFQFSFLFYMFMLTALMMGILFSSNIIFMNSCIELGTRIGLPAHHVYFDLISSQRSTMKAIFLYGSLAAFLCMTIFGVLFSHRIAGPLHRLKLYIEEMTAGPPKRDLEFRKDDYFTELADATSELSEKIYGTSHPSGGAKKKKK